MPSRADPDEVDHAPPCHTPGMKTVVSVPDSTDTIVDRLNAVVDALEDTEDRFVAATSNNILSRVAW